MDVCLFILLITSTGGMRLHVGLHCVPTVTSLGVFLFTMNRAEAVTLTRRNEPAQER